MSIINGEWIMKGLAWDDPMRIRSADELESWIDEVGFLPLFGNDIPGFSCEEHTFADDWWTDDPDIDPWQWRMRIAREGSVAYGKFFDGKSGFISLGWLPAFINYRREGLDFNERYEEGLASRKSQRIMALFDGGTRLPTFDIRRKAGFGRGGERDFSGVITELQMRTYLASAGFTRRRNRFGEEYGWASSVFATPETLWGEDRVCACHGEDPAVSEERILAHIKDKFPWAEEADIRRFCQA